MSATDDLVAEARQLWSELNSEPESPAVESAEPTPYEASIEAVETVNVLEAAPDPMDVLSPDVPSLADEVAERLNLEMVDALAGRIRALEVECQALRQIAADAVIAAREAVSLPYVDPSDEWFEEIANPRRRWWWFR